MDDGISIDIIKPAAKISLEERARRRAAVDYGRGSVRLEGFVVGPEVEELNRRYINGDLTRPELTTAILSRHGL